MDDFYADLFFEKSNEAGISRFYLVTGICTERSRSMSGVEVLVAAPKKLGFRN